jgi:hypothetical protein
MHMRRTVVIYASLLALAAPVTALAISAASGDGTLVVKNGSGPRGTPVVTLVIRGAAIGHIFDGSIVIDDLNPGDGFTPEVTGASWRKDVGGTVTKWRGVDFRFRTVGGSYKITIYGSGVDLVASGYGTVVLTGSSETPTLDGRYSLNGQDFKSLPATPTKQLTIGLPTSATG